MRNWIFIALAMISTTAVAQEVTDQTGMELGLTYRKGDSFLFCTEGQGVKNAPMQCWIPLPPYDGTSYMEMPYCDPPNQYGKPWTQDDYKSLQEYQSVCPAREMSSEFGTYDPENQGHRDRQPIDR